MDASAPSLSVVIPVYRSAAILPELLRRLEPVLAAVAPRFEILLVDDASPDESWSTIEKLAAQHRAVRGLSLGRNYGQHAAVRVRHDPRRTGASNYTFARLVSHALNMATGFSVVPLRLASLVGFAFTLFGTGVLAYVLGRYFLEGTSVPGFPFIASVVAIFSGAQLFALGIIGEYLARMHFRMMGRPPFTVRSRTPEEPA